MEETNLIVEGFKFMGLGMGTVFLFLVVMIVSMNILSFIVRRFFPEPQPSVTPPSPPKENKNIIAAVTAAIKHHRG